jgi:hypothetical protein
MKFEAAYHVEGCDESTETKRLYYYTAAPVGCDALSFISHKVQPTTLRPRSNSRYFHVPQFSLFNWTLLGISKSPHLF